MVFSMTKDPVCPKCDSSDTYADGSLWVCPACGHEWDPDSDAKAAEAAHEASLVRDAHGNILQDGDSVTVIKDLKVKGSSSVVKVGTKVKNIRIQSGGRRPRYRLADPRHRLHEFEVRNL